MDKTLELQNTIKALEQLLDVQEKNTIDQTDKLYYEICERKKNEGMLIESRESLRRKNQEIHNLTQTIVHDLNKPLTAMKTICSLLSSGKLGEISPTGKEALSTGRESIAYMQELLNDLRECTLLESNSTEIKIEEFPLAGLLGSVKERFKLQLAEKSIELSLPENTTVRADRKLLDKIFMNLVGNAIVYIGKPENPHIRITASPGQGMVSIAVSDNGIGIPAKSQPAIFDKFKRGGNVGDIPGTGLGLSIVKAAVEAQGGRIWLESAEGKGTIFYFTLPAA